jgi:hypothetical protein
MSSSFGVFSQISNDDVGMDRVHIEVRGKRGNNCKETMVPMHVHYACC